MEQGTFDFPDEPAAPVKLCECGCGKPAPIAKYNSSQFGYVKGQPTRFVRGHSAGANREGPRPTAFVEQGQRFGLGVVIEPEIRIPDNSSTGSYRGAKLRCDCGNEYDAGISSLLRGTPQSCGCYTKTLAAEAGRRGGRPIIDRTGQRYGKLSVIGFAGTESGHARWRCRCDCGAETVISAGSLLKAVGCGCMQTGPRVDRAPGATARLRILQQYQRGARSRGFVWELSDEDFDSLTSSDCHYCGQPPSTVFRAGKYEGGSFTYNGLDRRDPAQGYVRENVLPCCPFCNRAKSDMSYEDFMVWTLRLVMNQWDRLDN